MPVCNGAAAYGTKPEEVTLGVTTVQATTVAPTTVAPNGARGVFLNVAVGV